MVIYDKMLELGYKPDAMLNRVLVYVCKLDPMEVIWNSGPIDPLPDAPPPKPLA